MTIGGPPEIPKLEQCAITGKMVPRDELVEIQGMRVCAEGKAILMARLASGESLPGEHDHPTVLRRFGCIFLDGLIVGVPIAILNAMAMSMSGRNHMVMGACALIGACLQTLYFGAMHASGGQTVGKKAGNTVVVNLDGSPITSQTAFIRALAYCGPGMINSLAMMTGVVVLTAASSFLVFGWALADLLFALFDRNQQRALHDRIAGTRVIMK